MPLQSISLPRETAKTLRRFANWDKSIKIDPSGRGVISYRKKTPLAHYCAVEVWTDIHPETETTYDLKGLISGLVEVHRSNENSYLDRISRQFCNNPISKFKLDLQELSGLKVGLGKNEKRTIILDRKSEKVVTVDDLRQTTVAQIPEFVGEGYEIYLPLALVSALPRANYWVKLFEQNFAIFEELSGEFTVYTSLAGLKKLG